MAIRKAKFTWVWSKYRPGNKIRTLVWALLQASPGRKVLPTFSCWSQAPCLPILLITNVMNVSKEAMRGISFSVSLYLFFSIMIMDCIYFLDGSQRIKRWRAKRQTEWGDCKWGLQKCAFVFCCCGFVFAQFFLCISKQINSMPGSVRHSKHCSSGLKRTKWKQLLLHTVTHIH